MQVVCIGKYSPAEFCRDRLKEDLAMVERWDHDMECQKFNVFAKIDICDCHLEGRKKQENTRLSVLSDMVNGLEVLLTDPHGLVDDIVAMQEWLTSYWRYLPNGEQHPEWREEWG